MGECQTRTQSLFKCFGVLEKIGEWVKGARGASWEGKRGAVVFAVEPGEDWELVKLKSQIKFELVKLISLTGLLLLRIPRSITWQLHHEETILPATCMQAAKNWPKDLSQSEMETFF